jgi:hypothetical protein
MAKAKAKAKAKTKTKTAAPKAKKKAAAAKTKAKAKKPAPKAKAKTGGKAKATGNRQPKKAEKAEKAEKETKRPVPADRLFADWQPYPKIRRAELTKAQEEWLEEALASGRGYDLAYNGLFYTPEHNRRFLLGPPGPSDVLVRIGGQMVPLWNAVSDVASGHADSAQVVEAFRALAPNAALAAWEEIARGDAYDLHEAHALSFDEVDVPRTKNNVAHRTRFYGWMADASVALGDAGRRAAEALAASARTDVHGSAQAFIALLALTRHARAAGAELDAKYDTLVATLEGERAVTFATPVVQEIYDAIPDDRAAWLPPIRQ